VLRTEETTLTGSPIKTLAFAALLVGVLFAGPAWSADVPKDKAPFTAYMQNKLQLYSPMPINVVAPLSLSVGPANAAVALPSLKPLHKFCVASPSKCDHAVNDYVQEVARQFLQKPEAVTPSAAPDETQSSIAPEKPTCMPADAPNANTRDTCMPPIVDLQHSRPNFTPQRSCDLGQMGFSVEGVVVVSYVVRADGSVGNVMVEVHSDFSELDDAAVSMVAARHYFPATKNGKPIDNAMKAIFRFKCPDSAEAEAKPIGIEGPAALPRGTTLTVTPSCLPADAANAGTPCTPPRIDRQHSPRFQYPSDAAKAGQMGVAVIGFRIHADGSVSNVTVLLSSGFPLLDDAAVSQIAGRHYFPATENGTPVDFQTRSIFQFQIEAPGVHFVEVPGFPLSGAP
jgi:TonB family protein